MPPPTCGFCGMDTDGTAPLCVPCQLVAAAIERGERVEWPVGEARGVVRS